MTVAITGSGGNAAARENRGARASAANGQAVRLTLCELADAGLPGVESHSPFCLKVHRALRAAGLRYERRHAARPDAFRALNPAGQVPVLLVGDEPVADSTRILARIESLGGRSLLPAGGAHPEGSRAEALLWEELADTAVNGFLVAARWADDANWPGVREAYFAAIPGVVRGLVTSRLRAHVLRGLVARDVWRGGAAACWDRFELLLDQLEARAPREGFWLGPDITVADVSLFGQLQSFRTPLTPGQRARVQARPRLVAYLDRVDAATRA